MFKIQIVFIALSAVNARDLSSSQLSRSSSSEEDDGQMMEVTSLQEKKHHLVPMDGLRKINCYGGSPRNIMATTPDSHAGGPGFKSRCRPTKGYSPNNPIPRLQVAKTCQGSLPPKGAVWDGVH